MLKISQIRKIKDIIISKQYKNILPNIFKDKNRLLIDKSINFDFDKYTKSIKIPMLLKVWLNKNDYEIIDYYRGLVKNKNSKNNSIIKLGKVLRYKNNDFLLKLFETDKNRQCSRIENIKIIICRHPYDVAGMTTGRGWTSCLRFDNTQFVPLLINEISAGTIIAYIIHPKDTNIKNPISRILIKPYINKHNNIIYKLDNIFIGATVPGAREALEDWLINNYQILDNDYHIHPKCYSAQNVRNELQINRKFVKRTNIINKESDNWTERLNYYKNDINNIYSAKYDQHHLIRQYYYQNNKLDSDAKYDKNIAIRFNYYIDNLSDPDLILDKSDKIRQLKYIR